MTAADFLSQNAGVQDIAQGSLADQLNLTPEQLTGGGLIAAGIVLFLLAMSLR